MTRIRTLLADDHTMVLEGLRAVLKSYEEIDVCGEARNGQEVLDFVRDNPVDVVVLDINMPVMDGLTCARRLKSTRPEVRIVILTMYAQKSFVEEIIKIGVDGCLLKTNSGKELGDAILRVFSGKSYYDLIQTFTEDKSTIFQYKLSQREIQIIKLLAEGLTSGQIAEKLFIAEHTVKTHRKNILRKTGATSTGHLVQIALNNHLL